MIKQLQQKLQAQTQELDEQLDQYHESLSSFNIIEDPKFEQYVQEHKQKLQFENDQDDETNATGRWQTSELLSVSALNESIQNLTSVSETLNDLWVMKGIIQEIESFISMQQHGSFEFELSDFDYLYSNFDKFQGKLNKLNNDLLIKTELINKQGQLVQDLKQLFISIWDLYFPATNKFILLVNNIEFLDIVGIIEKFGNLYEAISLNELLSPLRLQWENYLLDIPNKHLTLVSTESSFDLQSVQGNDPTDLSGDHVAQSLTSIQSFVEFISVINIHSLKAYYQLKLSNKLINIISESINILVNDKTNNEKLMKIVNTLGENHWSLSMDLTAQNYAEKLQYIFNNWLIDNYIHKIRTEYKSDKLESLQDINWKVDNNLTVNDFEQKLNDMEKKIDRISIDHSEPKPENDAWDDGWNEEWNDDEDNAQTMGPEPHVAKKGDDVNEDEDGWGDWNEWDNEPAKDEQQPQAQEKSGITPVVNNSLADEPSVIETRIKVSQLPNALIEIINDFQIESTEDIDILISTILSLATITYPKLITSYLMYNDLQYLGKNLSNDRLLTFSENMIKRQQTEISQQVTMILIKIRFNDDIEETNHMVYRLIDDWFQEKFTSELSRLNYHKFKQLINYAIDIINQWIINLILSNEDISNRRSEQLTRLIDNVELIYKKYLAQVKEDDIDKLETVHKLNNFKFLINNHLVDIIERFYQGELYDITTNELVSTIKNCFIKSDLRDNYINEIIEFRNIN